MNVLAIHRRASWGMRTSVVVPLVAGLGLAGCGGSGDGASTAASRQASGATKCTAPSTAKSMPITFYNHLRTPVRLTATIPNCNHWGSPNPTNYNLTLPALTTAGPGEARMRVTTSLLAVWSQRFTVPVGKDSTGTMEYRALPVTLKTKAKWDTMYQYRWAIEPDPRGDICATCEPITSVNLPKVGTFTGGTVVVVPTTWTIKLYP